MSNIKLLSFSLKPLLPELCWQGRKACYQDITYFFFMWDLRCIYLGPSSLHQVDFQAGNGKAEVFSKCVFLLNQHVLHKEADAVL